jgi:hypothetical protein
LFSKLVSGIENTKEFFVRLADLNNNYANL